MKQILVVLLVLYMSSGVFAQELMTIGEVFDYNVGDKFQKRETGATNLLNAYRIEILEKYFSQNSDTVFYVIHNNSYGTEIIWDDEPYLEYNITNRIDTLSYTNLDSSLIFLDSHFEIEPYFENPSELCDIIINGYEYSEDHFESDIIIKEYGKGLGLTYSYFYSGIGHTIEHKYSLFYYKKGELECGTLDLTNSIFNNIEKPNIPFSIFPVPANSFINIVNSSGAHSFQYNILNLNGQTLISDKAFANFNKINISNLKQGLYFIQILFDDKIVVIKFIKE